MPLYNPPATLTQPITTVTTNTTVDLTYYTVLANASSAPITIALPPAANCPGKIYVFKKVDSTGNVVTIDPDGTETIDGQTSQSLDGQWESITVQSTGTVWNIN